GGGGRGGGAGGGAQVDGALRRRGARRRAARRPRRPGRLHRPLADRRAARGAGRPGDARPAAAGGGRARKCSAPGVRLRSGVRTASRARTQPATHLWAWAQARTQLRRLRAETAYRTRPSRAAAGGNRGFWGGALGRDDLAARAHAGPRAAAAGPARVPAEACDARLGPVPGGAGGHEAGEALPRLAAAARARAIL